MTIVITGASGRLGRRVTELLLTEHGVAPADLVLVTRSPETVAVEGAQVRRGDFEDPASLESAFAGAGKALIVSTDRVGTRVPGHKAAIDAAIGRLQSLEVPLAAVHRAAAGLAVSATAAIATAAAAAMWRRMCTHRRSVAKPSRSTAPRPRVRGTRPRRTPADGRV